MVFVAHFVLGVKIETDNINIEVRCPNALTPTTDVQSNSLSARSVDIIDRKWKISLLCENSNYARAFSGINPGAGRSSRFRNLNIFEHLMVIFCLKFGWESLKV